MLKNLSAKKSYNILLFFLGCVFCLLLFYFIATHHIFEILSVMISSMGVILLFVNKKLYKEKKISHHEMNIQQERYRILSEMSNDVIVDWNLIEDSLYVSPNWLEKYHTKMPNLHLSDYVQSMEQNNSEGAKVLAFVQQQIAQGEQKIICEFRIHDLQNKWIWVQVRATVLRNEQGVANRLIGVLVDIDEAKKIEFSLRRKAEYDVLTKFYNRVTFEEIAQERIISSNKQNSRLGFLFIDIDDFREFNNSYGHAFGDRVLRFVSEIIMRCVPEGGIVGRMGGDEFVICIENPDSPHLEQIAEDINHKLQTEFKFRENEYQIGISCSIGIVLYPECGSNYEELIHQADKAMFTVKKQGKGSYLVNY